MTRDYEITVTYYWWWQWWPFKSRWYKTTTWDEAHYRMMQLLEMGCYRVDVRELNSGR